MCGNSVQSKSLQISNIRIASKLSLSIIWSWASLEKFDSYRKNNSEKQRDLKKGIRTDSETVGLNAIAMRSRTYLIKGISVWGSIFPDEKSYLERKVSRQESLSFLSVSIPIKVLSFKNESMSTSPLRSNRAHTNVSFDQKFIDPISWKSRCICRALPRSAIR